ncbi:MAG TPA: hypothetical protein VMM78_08000 [Thermomicrobiales bacterium]|nr:hypothetical protein [Thermomicrobiales bacterium]
MPANTGPAVGQRFPTFALPDQHGWTIDFDASRAGREAIVVFYRSADW